MWSPIQDALVKATDALYQKAVGGAAFVCLCALSSIQQDK